MEIENEDQEIAILAGLCPACGQDLERSGEMLECSHCHEVWSDLRAVGEWRRFTPLRSSNQSEPEN